MQTFWGPATTRALRHIVRKLPLARSDCQYGYSLQNIHRILAFSTLFSFVRHLFSYYSWIINEVSLIVLVFVPVYSDFFYDQNLEKIKLYWIYFFFINFIKFNEITILTFYFFLLYANMTSYHLSKVYGNLMLTFANERKKSDWLLGQIKFP